MIEEERRRLLDFRPRKTDLEGGAGLAPCRRENTQPRRRPLIAVDNLGLQPQIDRSKKQPNGDDVQMETESKTLASHARKLQREGGSAKRKEIKAGVRQDGFRPAGARGKRTFQNNFLLW
jgi:hypothetical protein